MFFFFFNDTATTEIYTLSLHDALPISQVLPPGTNIHVKDSLGVGLYIPFPDFGDNPSYAATEGDRKQETGYKARPQDRKSTRLNSSHLVISYAVFCLKKKKAKRRTRSS